MATYTQAEKARIDTVLAKIHALNRTTDVFKNKQTTFRRFADVLFEAVNQ